jgi:epoxyqueuosine reductase QueG
MLSSRTVIERAVDLGFDLAGIAPLGIWKDLEFSREWVVKGFNGEMRYLDNPKRFDPLLVLPSAKSVICVGLVYNAPLPYSTEVPVAGKSRESGVRSQETKGKVSGFKCGVPGKERKEDFRIAQAPSPQPRASFFSNGQRAADHGQSTIPSADFPFSIFQFPTRAWISRYAWGRDYHEVMRAKLEQLRVALEELAPGVETRLFVDTGPVVERAFARFSGIGWVGKNTCTINEDKGSWFFLGIILSSLELAPDSPAPDRCGSCTACLEACPTGALVEPYVMDASRCISYLTIELRGPIPEEFRPKIGGNVFGCDICQDVCPWNSSRQSSVFSCQQATSPRVRPTVSPQSSAISRQQPSPQQEQPLDRRHATHPAITKVSQFHPMIVQSAHPMVAEGSTREPLTTDHGPRTTDDGPRTMDHGQRTTDPASFSLFNPPLDALASLSKEDFRRIFVHSPIKRAKWRGWLRNLAVAIGNSGDERFVPWLERVAQHSDPVVREHAAWALERLRGK